jgi:hypothetical protein
MRIAIRGGRSLGDVKKHLIEMLDHLERVGATHSTRTNLYLNLCDEAGTKLVPVAGDGEEFAFYEFPAPGKAKPESPGTNVVPFPRK